MSEELTRALERVRNHRMSVDEIEAQRISFVYGNASSEDNGTRESVKSALELAQVS